MFEDNRKNIISALKIISERLNKNNINWVLIGGTSLYFQGVDVKIKDIDILTDKKGALECNEIFKEFVVNPVQYTEIDIYKSYIGQFEINGVPVEFCAELYINSGNKWIYARGELGKPIKLKMGNLIITTFSLSDELKAYEAFNRDKDKLKIQKIKEKLGYK